MRKAVIATLLVFVKCEAGVLRQKGEGFEVVGSSGSTIQQRFSPEYAHRVLTLTNKEDQEIDEPVKEYVNDESLAIVEPDLSDRRQSTSCKSNEKLFQLKFKTDTYGYETSYKLERLNADNNWTKIDYGPKYKLKFADDSTYSPKGTCLVGGKRYRLTMMDSGKDGLCCKYSKGMYQYSLDGDVMFSSKSQNTFTQKAIKVFVVPMPNVGSDLPLSGRGGTSVCGTGKQQLRIVLKLDQYGDENSWEVRSLSDDRVVKSASKGAYSASSSDDVEFCVDDGMYRFTIWDETGDGICCRNGDGLYKLFMDGDLMINESFYNSGTKRSHDIIVGYAKSLSMTERELAYLDAHNWRRKERHEAAGESYVALKWSSGLAENALKYATELLDDCDVVGIKHEPNQEQGENLAKNAGNGEWGQLYPVENIVRRWVEREDTFDFPHNAHLTQAVWRSSHYLGCGESKKTLNNSGTCHIQVCRYARAGNCNFGKYNSDQGDNWKIPMLMDTSPCGPACPPEGVTPYFSHRT